VHIDAAIRSLAVRQHGLVTRAQVSALGVTRQAWYRALNAGRLLAVAPGVAALPGVAPSAEQRILAAVLSLGPGTMASHTAAAYLWGVPVAPIPPVDITTIHRNRGTTLSWVHLHTPTDLGDLRPVVRQGVPTTNPLRLLCDLGQTSPGSVERVLEHFLLEGTVSRSAAQTALRRHARKGRHGVVALRDALESWSIGDKPPDSRLELRMAELTRRWGLPQPEFHALVCGYEVDFLFRPEQLVVECDGWDAHGRDRKQFERDRGRDAELAAKGWLVLRFTWFQITRRPGWVADRLGEVLELRRRAA
jgi:hypothetical protein